MWNPEKKKVLDTAFNQIEKQVKAILVNTSRCTYWMYTGL